MKNRFVWRSLAALGAGAVLLLAGCGGGGGGGGSSSAPTAPASRFPPSSQFAGICTIAGQKQFVRSFLDETYLWYNEIQDVDSAQYATPEAYFDALLVKSKDRFSVALYNGPLRVLRSGQPQAASAALQASGAGAVTAANVQTRPNGRNVGYVQFDNQNFGSQDELIAAFQKLQATGVQDLVLDLRRNTGGFLYVALAASSMITGPQAEGSIFEQLRYNDKRQALTDASTLRFSSKLQFAESVYPVGTSLPQLNLPRVLVLTSPETCSASESIINSLRGIGVAVVRIGSNTCGKPYGFHDESTCGGAYHYFAIEFQGFNAKGFGDYQGTGFAPNCQVADSGTRGTGSDALLNSALYYVDNGACPPGTVTTAQAAATPIVTTPPPVWGARLLLPEQQRIP